VVQRQWAAAPVNLLEAGLLGNSESWVLPRRAC
jgi:hypothetical protein